MQEYLYEFFILSMRCSLIGLPLALLFHYKPLWIPSKTIAFLWTLLFLRMWIPFTTLLPILPPDSISVGSIPVLDELFLETSKANVPERVSSLNSSNLESLPPLEENALYPISKPQIKTAQILIGIWFVGAIGFFISFAINLLRIQFTIRNSAPIKPGKALRLFEECKLRIGVDKAVMLLVSSRNLPTGVYGAFSPNVIISQKSLDRLAPEVLEFVFFHELSHVKRRDSLVNALVLPLCYLNWFNPLIWLWYRYFRDSIELACDELALQGPQAPDPAEYGLFLLDMHKLDPGVRKETVGSVGLFGSRNKTKLKRRITTISQFTQERRFGAGLSIAALGILGLVLATSHAQQTNEAIDLRPLPEGWFQTGSPELKSDYTLGIDANAEWVDPRSGYIKYTGTAETVEGFSTLMQSASPTEYLGKRVRFSAYIQSRNVSEKAWLWARTDVSNGRGTFDNCYDRALSGSKDWTLFEIVLDVPEDAFKMSYGLGLTGKGEAWMNGFTIEVVDNTVPSTDMHLTNKTPPQNLDFGD